MEKIHKGDIPPQFLALIKQAEDTIEKVLVPLHALCPDDVPVIKWKGDQWQPELVNDDIYPQYHRSEDYALREGAKQQPADRYEVLWALPLCGRDQTRQWHDKIGLTNGTARYVLLFHFEFKVRRGDRELAASSIECLMGMYEGYKEDGRSVVSVFRNDHGSDIPITVPLLATLAKHVEDLSHHREIERQVGQVLRNIQLDHPEYN
jgi:hypothetical protein